MRQATLWVVVGATGSGKTQYSLDLATRLQESGYEPHIVNADSMQLYQGMDVGTAKITRQEMGEIPHHFFDVLNVTDEATVAWYQPAARKLIEELLLSGSDVILVGGSGLYVSSVIYDFEFPPRDEALRQKLNNIYETQGIQPLIEKIQKVAPKAAKEIDLQNPRRVIRALEVALLGSENEPTLPSAPKLWWADTRIRGLHVAREELTKRLDERVVRMWDQGMIEEVTGLLGKNLLSGPTASRAIGYSQAVSQINEELSEAEAILETQKLTRRYARRQVSWFKRYPEIVWEDRLQETTTGKVAGVKHTLLFDEKNVREVDIKSIDSNSGKVVQIVSAQSHPIGRNAAEDDPSIEWMIRFFDGDGDELEMSASGLILAIQYLIDNKFVSVADRRDTVSVATSGGIRDALLGNQTISLDLGRWRPLRELNALDPQSFSLLLGKKISTKMVESEKELNKLNAIISPPPLNTELHALINIKEIDAKTGIGEASARFYDQEGIELEGSVLGAAATAIAARHKGGRGMPHHWRIETRNGPVPVRMFPTEEGEHISVSGQAEFELP